MYTCTCCRVAQLCVRQCTSFECSHKPTGGQAGASLPATGRNPLPTAKANNMQATMHSEYATTTAA